MNVLKSLALAGVLLLAVATPSPAAGYAPRQYYTGWSYSTYGYYYRTYYYKPYATYTSYHHHYVLYYPSRPYYYCYNPYKRVYWGRLPVQNNCKAGYSQLDEEHRKGTLNKIKEEQFPKPGPMPAVPGSKDGARITMPPADLPTGAALPKGG